MAVGDAYVFPGFLTPVRTQLFFPEPPTTFLTCFCRGERRKYAGKKIRLNRVSNSQPPGHKSDTLTTEPPERDCCLEKDTVQKKMEQILRKKYYLPVFSIFCPCIYRYIVRASVCLSAKTFTLAISFDW